MHLKICQNLWIAFIHQIESLEQLHITNIDNLSLLWSKVSESQCNVHKYKQCKWFIIKMSTLSKLCPLLVSGFPLECRLAWPGSGLHLTPSSPHGPAPTTLFNSGLALNQTWFLCNPLLIANIRCNIHAALHQLNRLWLVESSLLNAPCYTLHAIRIKLI